MRRKVEYLIKNLDNYLNHNISGQSVAIYAIKIFIILEELYYPFLFLL